MDTELTSAERRYLLAALWTWKQKRVTESVSLADEDDDLLHAQEVGEICDSAAVKLGGDPSSALYGAGRF